MLLKWSSKRKEHHLLSLAIIVWLFLVYSVHSVEHILHGVSVKVDGLEYIYQIPPVERSKIKGIAFLAHGCSRDASDWWPRNNDCPKCVGMPICQSVTLDTIKHNFVAVASSSHPNERKCWNHEDYSRLPKILHHFYQKVFNDSSYSTPLHLIGFSNGGYFLGGLVQRTEATLKPIKIASLVVVINSIKLAPEFTKEQPFPIPTLFVPMKKDGGIYWRIQSILPFFKNAKVIVADEQPVTKDFLFRQGMGSVTEEESAEVYSLLKNNGFLDAKTDLLLQDPRSFNHWRELLWKNLPQLAKRDSLVHDHSPIWEMLNFAFAYHEVTNEKNREIFQFLENITIAD